MIGERLKVLRKERKMSQGDIQERTGLQRCYVSRVENGHTMPSIDTLRKMAGALKVPMYRFFYEGTEPPRALPLPKTARTADWGTSGKHGQYVRQMRTLLGKMDESDRRFLLLVAYKVARKKPSEAN